MSRQKKEQQKKKKREKARKEHLGKYRTMLTARGRDDGFLEYVFDRIRQKEYEEAREALLEYVETYPKIAKPFGILVSVCASLEDYANMFWAAERLLQVGQQTFEDYSCYHAACVANEMPATLLLCEEQMRRRFQFESDRDLTDMREEILASFKNDAAICGDDLTPYSDDRLLELMQWHEKSTLYLGSQRFDLAVRCCDQSIVRFPFFRSAYNNKVLAILLEHGPDAAEPALQEAFEHHPDNLFVIAFKIRQLALRGRHAELPDYCALLATVPLIFPNKHDFFVGKIEAFAWADDLERIIETYQLAREEMGEEWDVERPTCALATHYAAVAHARSGNPETSLELWKSIPPGVLPIATENLEDIQKPVGGQNGPWFFDLKDWLPKQFFTVMRQESARQGLDASTTEEKRHDLFEERVRPLFKKMFPLFPSLEHTLIEMLRRGGPDARTWVGMFIGLRETPEFKAAVIDFTLGKSGSDQCRREFTHLLAQYGWLQSDQIRVWEDGEQCEHQLINMDIHWETREMDTPLSPKAAKKNQEAYDLASEGDYEAAIELLLEINTLEPGRPSVLYNIASFYQVLDRNDLYDDIIDQLNRDFPDYFFGKVALAKRWVLQGRLEEALTLTTPLYKLGRLHGTEFLALSGAMVLYHLASGNVDEARSIHRIAVDVDEDRFPSLAHFQKVLEQNSPIPPKN